MFYFPRVFSKTSDYLYDHDHLQQVGTNTSPTNQENFYPSELPTDPHSQTNTGWLRTIFDRFFVNSTRSPDLNAMENGETGERNTHQDIMMTPEHFRNLPYPIPSNSICQQRSSNGPLYAAPDFFIQNCCLMINGFVSKHIL